MLLYVLLPTNASRMRNEINPCNYMRKSNQQPYSPSANSINKVECRWQSLRQFCLTYADALWWDRKHYAHQQVSDSSVWLMPMHFILKSKISGTRAPRVPELGRVKSEIPVPLTALWFHHPQCLQNIFSMAPRAKRRSLCKQRFDRIFRAVVI